MASKKYCFFRVGDILTPYKANSGFEKGYPSKTCQFSRVVHVCNVDILVNSFFYIKKETIQE